MRDKKKKIKKSLLAFVARTEPIPKYTENPTPEEQKAVDEYFKRGAMATLRGMAEKNRREVRKSLKKKK